MQIGCGAQGAAARRPHRLIGEILLEEGVAPDKIQIAHTGDSDDLDYIERLLEQGVWIGMDRYGLDIFLPMERRNATMKIPTMVKATARNTK